MVFVTIFENITTFGKGSRLLLARCQLNSLDTSHKDAPTNLLGSFKAKNPCCCRDVFCCKDPQQRSWPKKLEEVGFQNTCMTNSWKKLGKVAWLDSNLRVRNKIQELESYGKFLCVFVGTSTSFWGLRSGP